MQSLTKRPRDAYIDLLKGLGIIAVVLGHAVNASNGFGNLWVNLVHNFVYTYHLPIFFVVAGYVFDLKKQKSFFAFLTKKIKSLYIPFVLWGVFFAIVILCLGNTFRSACGEIFRFMIFKPRFGYAGALWFVPWMFFSQILFYVANRVLQNQNKIVQTICFALMGIFGVLLTSIKMGFYNIDLVFMMMPVMYCGNIFKIYKENVFKFLNKYGIPTLILTAVSIIALDGITGLQIDFAYRQIYGGIWVFPIIALGVLFCMALASCINNYTQKISLFVQCCGKNSFTIMALHFLVFKAIDYIANIVFYSGQVPKETLEFFPYSFPQLRLVYIVAGICLPILISYIAKKIFNTLSKGKQNEKNFVVR